MTSTQQELCIFSIIIHILQHAGTFELNIIFFLWKKKHLRNITLCTHISTVGTYQIITKYMSLILALYCTDWEVMTCDDEPMICINPNEEMRLLRNLACPMFPLCTCLLPAWSVLLFLCHPGAVQAVIYTDHILLYRSYIQITYNLSYTLITQPLSGSTYWPCNTGHVIYTHWSHITGHTYWSQITCHVIHSYILTNTLPVMSYIHW